MHTSLGLAVTSREHVDGDDLTIRSSTKEASKVNIVALLKYLADQGHKASLARLQFQTG